jgi:hypothetical protein
VADRPDGSAAGTQRVAFTKPAAERIARVVRKVEAGDRDGQPWSVSPRFTPDIFRLHVATFTGAWEIGTYKTVTLRNSDQTASVYNWCTPAPLQASATASTASTRLVIYGKSAGRNSVVEIQVQETQCTATLTLGTVDLSTLPGYEAGVIQMLGHGAQDTASTCSGGLQWYSITTCSTATAS